VFFYLAGESSIDGSTIFDQSLIKLLIQQFNGIGIILENRWYGTSNPFNTSTTDELRYLTTEQVIADFDYFARNVKLLGHKNINAPHAPWIVYGGSYPGALSAFTMKTYGNTFYAGISSSGVIHGQLNYPQWYDPIQLIAPQDCVASINNIVDKIDLLVAAKNTAALQRLKQIFGLQALTDIRDFAQTIAFPIGGPFVYPTYS
jgi:Serine carboxypeptidase S28